MGERDAGWEGVRMNPEFGDGKTMLDLVLQQEKSLRFASFTMEDGWKLGLIIRDRVTEHGGNAAVDVTVGGVQLFRCAVGVPTPNNSRWIRRKMNTVLENWKSSLRVTIEMEMANRTLEGFGMSAAEFALSGGSFPIWVEGQGVIGTATVSGLPQTHDHQMVAESIAQMLTVSVPNILQPGK